jgi:hypothetical protein
MMPAMPVEFPKPQVVALQELAARLIDGRKAGGDLERLARDLLHGFFDVCVRAGLDRVLVELEQAFPPLDSSERTALADHESVSAALVAQLGTIKLDDGGPRNAKPRQIADCVVVALGLTVVTEPDRSILLGDDVRGEVAAALAGVLDVEFAVPQIRETIIAEARARCDESLHAVFTKIAAQLDDRGLQFLKPPKVPIHTLHAVQRALSEARNAVVERVARTAIDRAQEVLGRANAEAAARIDRPITLRATPREVAILRACDAQVSKAPAKLAQSLLDSLRELASITWRAPERPVHPYSASRTFAVGDLIDHPKFGRGTVISRLAQRIDVEFADGKHTLAHVAPRQ